MIKNNLNFQLKKNEIDKSVNFSPNDKLGSLNQTFETSVAG